MSAVSLDPYPGPAARLGTAMNWRLARLLLLAVASALVVAAIALKTSPSYRTAEMRETLWGLAARMRGAASPHGGGASPFGDAGVFRAFYRTDERGSSVTQPWGAGPRTGFRYRSLQTLPKRVVNP